MTDCPWMDDAVSLIASGRFSKADHEQGVEFIFNFDLRSIQI